MQEELMVNVETSPITESGLSALSGSPSAGIGASVDDTSEFTESIINTVRESLIILNHDLRVISASRSFYDVFKVKPEETVGQLIYDLGNKQWDIPKLRELLETILPQKTTFDSYEVEHDFTTIGKRIMLLNARQIQRVSGKERIILLAIEDITERKHLQDESRRYNVQLEQKTRDLEQIIYVTSHDLRSPLVNVQGFSNELTRSLAELTEAIHNGDISPAVLLTIEPILKTDIPEALEFIKSGVNQMDIQISALLKLSRLGRMVSHPEKLDMNRLVTEIVKTLEYVAQEKKSHIAVAELPSCMSDVAQTNQIFLNLIENALKYLDAKQPGVIRISGLRKENEIIYCIEDNGVGIAPEFQKKIFEIFYRVERGNHAGEGLGLTIVRQCVERQNGAVWVESELGKGSRFFVQLPAA